MTAMFLINCMPSRILNMKSPCELLLGENKFVVPPKVFGCTCFVRDHRPSVTKLDPRAVKCIFIGYPAGQRGYKCWNPSERRTFVSLDVTFWESEPFYGEKTDLSSIFEGLDQPTNPTGQEGENASTSTDDGASNNHFSLGPYHLLFQTCHKQEVGQSQMKTMQHVCTHEVQG